MKRRQFLKALPIGAMATAIPFRFAGATSHAFLNSPLMNALTNSTQSTNKVLVIVFMEGGNDGLNTLVPFENPSYDKFRRSTGFSSPAEKASLTFKVRGDLGFNPSFNALQPLWEEGKMGIVQNVGIKNADLSHFRATDIWNSASDTDLLIPTGWAARYLNTLYPTYPVDLPEDPIAISMGTLQSSIFQSKSGKSDMMVQDPRIFGASGIVLDGQIPATAGGTELRFVEELINVSNSYSKRFQSIFPAAAVNKVDYPDNPLAENLRKIAWCIAAGMGTRIYFTSLNGFDTHSSQFSKDPTVFGQGERLKFVADAILAFQRDLEAFSIADNVLTMTYSEFGRRVSENGSAATGTDHGTTAPQFLFGTQVNGELYGHHPDLDHLDTDGNAENEFEFRQLYASVLGDWFGVDESLRTSILSPGRNHNPFDIEFPVNGSNTKAHLIKGFGSTSVKRSSNFSSRIFPATPNPFADQTTIRFELNERQNVKLDLFDSRGGELGTLVNTSYGRGSQSVTISARNLIAGSYYYRMQIGNEIEKGKVVCLK
ncbi:MAG: DUF1501 domain-containing protein [Ignavibacteriota bacterium]